MKKIRNRFAEFLRKVADRIQVNEIDPPDWVFEEFGKRNPVWDIEFDPDNEDIII